MGEKFQKWKDLMGSEFEYCLRLGNCFSDPEQRKSFWQTLEEKKKANPSYSIYDDHPRSECAKTRAMNSCIDFVRGLRRPVKKEGEAS